MTDDFKSRMLRRRLRKEIVFPCVQPIGNHDPYPVTYPYGVPDSRYQAGHHTGEDHACPEGAWATAVTWGTVVHAGPATSWGEAYGNQVIIRTADGRHDYAYCHLSRVLVHEGDRVTPGTLLGLTGQTGNATGPHLHFEARPAGGHYGSDVPPITVKRRSLTQENA